MGGRAGVRGSNSWCPRQDRAGRRRPCAGRGERPPEVWLRPTHGAAAGEQVDHVVIERRHVVGNEDPDAGVPEPRVLLPGHEPQHRTHGPHHEPAGAGGRDCAARLEPGPDPPRAPGSEPAEDAVRQRAADEEDVDPQEEAQDEEAEPDGRVEQQREEQEAVTREPGGERQDDRAPRAERVRAPACLPAGVLTGASQRVAPAPAPGEAPSRLLHGRPAAAAAAIFATRRRGSWEGGVSGRRPWVPGRDILLRPGRASHPSMPRGGPQFPAFSGRGRGWSRPPGIRVRVRLGRTSGTGVPRAPRSPAYVPGTASV